MSEARKIGEKFRVKRRRVVLTIKEKTKIVEDFEKGLSASDIMRKYCIPGSTAYDLKNNSKLRDEIAHYQIRTEKRKSLKKAKYPPLDNALYIWFLQKREQHIPVSQDMLVVQAIKLFKDIYGEGQFTGSRGYIGKFIQRHNIRFLKITGEKLSNDVSNIDAYVNQFARTVRQNELTAAQIFNADESGLYYRCTPSSTFVGHGETSAPGRKGNKERITFMPCSNADGSFKLPLMMIGKSRKPRALKNISVLPVHYTSSKNAWMTRALFREWFFQESVTKVTAFLKSANLPVRAVLVLDNCSAHCSSDDLKTANGEFTTIFLPPNTTAILQPMDQNIIQMLKASYRHKLMREIIGRPGEFDENIKRISLKDAIFWVAEAWEEIPAESISKSWKMLYTEPHYDDEDNMPLSAVRERIRMIQQRIGDVSSSGDNEEENAKFELMGDADIVNAVLNDDGLFYDGERTLADEAANASVAEEISDEEYPPVSDQAALNNIDTVITWAEENQLPLDRQFLLREIRGNILNKIVNKV